MCLINMFRLVLFGTIIRHLDAKRIGHLLGTTGFGTISIPEAELQQIKDRCFNNMRIMDGEELSDISHFRFLAAILGEMRVADDRGRLIKVQTTCGGVFIHPNIIATAKHCVYRLDQIKIRYGGLKSVRVLRNLFLLDSETTDDIKAIRFEEGDPKTDPTNDFAFIQVGDIDQSKVDYICLPQMGDQRPSRITVLGWGRWEGGKVATKLRFTDLSTQIPNEISDYANCRPPMFCAIPVEGRKDTQIAEGNSGGPAMTPLVHTLQEPWPTSALLYGLIVESFEHPPKKDRTASSKIIPASVFLDVSRITFKNKMCRLTGLCFDV